MQLNKRVITLEKKAGVDSPSFSNNNYTMIVQELNKQNVADQNSEKTNKQKERNIVSSNIPCDNSVDNKSNIECDEQLFVSNCTDKVDSFADMKLSEELLRGIYGYGLENPSVIQQCAIRPILDSYVQLMWTCSNI